MVCLGTTNISSLSLLLYDLDDLAISIYGFVFLIFFIFFKLSVVPFHMWAPDVYEGSSWPVVVLISGILKLPVLIFLIRLFLLFGFDTVVDNALDYLLVYLNIFGIFSVFLGVFGALVL